MKKIKYYYNTHTLRYEKLITPLRVKLLRVFGFLAAAFVTAALIAYFAFRFIGSPYEKKLRAENEQLEGPGKAARRSKVAQPANGGFRKT
jgi:peptidoglycan/LPS O-acetylase OafA/YrhL